MSSPAMEAMRNEDWASLTSSIENGRCMLMLGPDAFRATIDGEDLPVAVGLARFVREKLGPAHADLDPNRPWSVAQRAIAVEDSNTLLSWAEQFYQKTDTVSEPLKNFASLPFRYVVNTSPGFAAELAFKSAKPETHSYFYNRAEPAPVHLPDASARAPILYGLYGSFREPGSIVLSEYDRFEFLISVITENPPLPSKLMSALRDPSQSFLFVGFNLAQWQLRMLLYFVLKKVQRENKSFALELQRDELDDDARLFYTTGHKVRFVDMDFPTLAAELAGRIREKPPKDASRANAGPVSPDAPTVFLCHAHEDAAFARALSQGIRENGINVWLDKDDLRGGDRWDDAIERTLADVQYVVVLQSKSLRAKDVGYVNKEINLAIERQAYYRRPRIFLIPAIIDSPDSQIDDLKSLQSVDLSAPDGVNELVRTIRRDVDIAGRDSVGQP